MPDLIRKCGPTEFDHVVLGTRDTREGAAWIAEKTGVAPVLTDPEPGQWYHSAALPLGDGAMLEILGPNPAHRGFHPFKTLLAALDPPELIFWHLGTEDFDAFCAAAAAAGAPVERIEEISSEGRHGRRAYRRGVVRPGFRSVRPCVIEWTARPIHPEMSNPTCAARRFAVHDPAPEKLNHLFEALGLDLRATAGPQKMSLELDSPKGPVHLNGGTLRFEGLGALVLTGRLWVRHLLARG